MKISLINDPKICVAKWFQIGPKRLMLAIICVWQYLLWLGPDPPPTPPLISSIHYNTMSQERRGWPNQDYKEPLNQRGNKDAWTFKGCFDFVVVVIMFHECWVLLKVEELCLCPMDKVNNALLLRKVLLPRVSAESESHIIELTGFAITPPVLSISQHAALLVFLDGLKLISWETF